MPNLSSFIVTSVNVTFPSFFTITAYSIVSFTSAFSATVFSVAFFKLDVLVTFTPSVLSTTGFLASLVFSSLSYIPTAIFFTGSCASISACVTS